MFGNCCSISNLWASGDKAFEDKFKLETLSGADNELHVLCLVVLFVTFTTFSFMSNSSVTSVGGPTREVELSQFKPEHLL